MHHTLTIVLLGLMLTACSSSQTTLYITMVKHECGGAFGQTLATETTPAKGDIFYISRNDSKLKPVKIKENNALIVKGSRGEIKLFIPEKVHTEIQFPGGGCDRWRSTPDVSFNLQKGKHTLPVYFEVICNPCLLPRP